MPLMPVQIFIQSAKSEEDFLYLSKITKNDSKNIGLKVSSLIFTFFSAHGMGLVLSRP